MCLYFQFEKVTHYRPQTKVGAAYRGSAYRGVCPPPFECFLVHLHRSISIYFGSYIRNSITFSVNALLVIPLQLMLNNITLMSKWLQHITRYKTINRQKPPIKISFRSHIQCHSDKNVTKLLVPIIRVFTHCLLNSHSTLLVLNFLKEIIDQCCSIGYEFMLTYREV